MSVLWFLDIIVLLLSRMIDDGNYYSLNSKGCWFFWPIIIQNFRKGGDPPKKTGHLWGRNDREEMADRGCFLPLHFYNSIQEMVEAEAQKPRTFRVATFYAQKLSGRSARNRFSRLYTILILVATENWTIFCCDEIYFSLFSFCGDFLEN